MFKIFLTNFNFQVNKRAAKTRLTNTSDTEDDLSDSDNSSLNTSLTAKKKIRQNSYGSDICSNVYLVRPAPTLATGRRSKDVTVINLS